jgi:hypothetical protein
MRLFGRILILAGIFSASLPASTTGAPILGVGSTGCMSVLGGDPMTCSHLSVDPFGPEVVAGTLAITGEFTFYNDVALFSFMLSGDTLFSARTTSYAVTGFDSTFAIFNADANRTMVLSADGSQYARSADVTNDGDPATDDFDDQLSAFMLSGGNYILALVMYPNDFRQDPAFGLADSLLAGFQLDAFEPLSCEPSCGFSLEINAQLIDDGGPQPVPEPGTLALFGTGALAALVRRRSRKRV